MGPRKLTLFGNQSFVNLILWEELYWAINHGGQTPNDRTLSNVDCITKGANPCLAKQPLKFDGGLAESGLPSVIR